MRVAFSFVKEHAMVGAEEARAAPAHSTGELRRLLREREADLRAAMGEAQAGRAQVRRLNTQLQAVNAQKEELRVAKVALEEKVAAPVLSESAQRYSTLRHCWIMLFDVVYDMPGSYMYEHTY